MAASLARCASLSAPDLVSRKRFGEVAGVTDVGAKRRRPFGVRQRLRDGPLYGAEDMQEPLNVVGFSKLNLMADQD